MSDPSAPQPASAEARKIRIAIVDDSIVVRGLFSRWLAEEADIEIVGIHRNGLEALRNVGIAKPDVVLLDIEMPEMDGLTALPLILQKSPGTRVLVVSSLSHRGADITLKCLMRGATDYLSKPSAMGSGETPAEFRQSLVARIRAIGAPTPARAAAVAAGAHPPGGAEAHGAGAAPRKKLSPEASAAVMKAAKTRPHLLLLGAATGGPQAVAALLDSLGPIIDEVPVVIAQHMPAIFTQMFAAHLKRQLCVESIEIEGGEVLKPGVIHVCAGGQNSLIRRSGADLTVLLQPGNGETRTLPSIDLLFASAAREVGAGVVAIALTGLGTDGAQGALAVSSAGGVVMAQDQTSSVVWGIPGAVARTGTCALIDDVQGLAEGVRLLFDHG